MKRALDLSSLPNNPISGQQPRPPFFSQNSSERPAKRPRDTATNSFKTQIPDIPFTPIMTDALPAASPIAAPRPAIADGSQAGFVPNVPLNYGYGMMSYGGPIAPPTMNPNTMTGNYGPAAAAAAYAAAGNTTGRTVYVGMLPSEASVDELLNLVRFGPIENVHVVPEDSCVFISFLNGSTAAAFYADASVKRLALHGQALKIGWGRPSPLPRRIAQAVEEKQATRNVFVGNLSPETNEQDLRNTCSKYGPIDQVKIVRDKNIGFIHFLSISVAMKVVEKLAKEPGWEDKRVSYGKDRCAYVPKAQQAAVLQAQQQAAAALAAQHAQLGVSPFGPYTPVSATFSNFGGPHSPLPSANGFSSDAFNDQTGNRNIYLGNIHPDTTVEELCNNIRGGALQQIKLLTEKNIAFVVFVDASTAAAFKTNAEVTGLTINSRRIKVGWGKHSGPTPPALVQAVQAGASRNVYIGQITDFDLFTVDKLRADFEQYGEIEMINFLREKSAAFVNFTSIQAAQKAVEGIKANPEYASFRVSHGKDRCANPPRQQGAGSRPNNPRINSQGSNGASTSNAGQAAVTSAPAPATATANAATAVAAVSTPADDAVTARIAAVERASAQDVPTVTVSQEASE